MYWFRVIKYTIITMVLLFLGSGADLNAQMSSITKSGIKDMYLYDEGSYHLNEIDIVFPLDTDASKVYKLGKRWSRAGQLAYYAGGVAFGYTTYLMLKGEDGEKIGKPFLIGTALVAIGITSIIVGKKKKRKAVKLYNDNLSQDISSLITYNELTINSNGFAFVHKF